MRRILDIISESIHVKESMLGDAALVQNLSQLVDALAQAFRAGKKVLLCGNGGSAADAQHIAAELTGRFFLDRVGLRAEALHVNTSYMTAVANDYSFDVVYSRLVEAMGDPGDVLIAISTSGKSKNVLLAVDAARKKGMITVAFTGANGQTLASSCDISIEIPAVATPRIQEAHILVGHIVCEMVEERLFG